MLGVKTVEKFNYYFNTRKRIDAALDVPINKATIPSILFNLIWDVYYNVTTDEQTIVVYIENWMKERTDVFHLSAYAKTIKSYIKKMKDMPWRNISGSVKIRKSELDYIVSFNDIKKEKLLFCYLAIAKFMDMSRKSHTHWENESDITVFKMAHLTVPAKDRDYFIHELIYGEPRALIYMNYKNDDTSKRIDYISDDESDPVVLELDESSYYELAFTYLNWKNGGGYKKCACCGKLFKVSSNIVGKNKQSELNQANRTQYCRTCAPNYEPKYKGKDELALDYKPKKIVCIDCGEEICLSSYMDTRACRCVDCNTTYQRERNARKNKEYRERNKAKA